MRMDDESSSVPHNGRWRRWCRWYSILAAKPTIQLGESHLHRVLCAVLAALACHCTHRARPRSCLADSALPPESTLDRRRRDVGENRRTGSLSAHRWWLRGKRRHRAPVLFTSRARTSRIRARRNITMNLSSSAPWSRQATFRRARPFVFAGPAIALKASCDLEGSKGASAPPSVAISSRAMD